MDVMDDNTFSDDSLDDFIIKEESSDKDKGKQGHENKKESNEKFVEKFGKAVCFFREFLLPYFFISISLCLIDWSQ